jgi:hypothetical protein
MSFDAQPDWLGMFLELHEEAIKNGIQTEIDLAGGNRRCHRKS